MKLSTPALDRRTLLIGGGIGIGLVVAFAAWPRRPDSALTGGPEERAFGHFIKIGRDGRVTVAVPQAEAGQGVWTALPQIVADELGAAWETVAVEPAPLAGVYANPLAEEQGWTRALGPWRSFRLGDQLRITAQSTSIRAFERPLREAGAMARAMLVGAAAERWGVSEEDCDTADGFVIQRGRTLPFGELAEEAASRSPPSDLRLRRPGSGRLAGQPVARLDLPAKSDGSFRFAGDVRLPDMLFASARLTPPGGRLAGHAQVPGRLVVRDGWIAAVADSWWAAERTLRAARPRFEAPVSWSADELRTSFDDALANGDAAEWFARGDYAAAVEGSRPLAATYWVAPAQHLGLEPVTATARFSGDRLEVWAPTQAPEFARAAAQQAAGDAASHVAFYPMPPGDPGGRALEADAVPLAVELARELGRPVQLTLSPAASQNHDSVAPALLARMIGLPGAGGITRAWKMRVATTDALGSAIRRMAGADASEALGRGALAGAIPSYGIPDVLIEAVPAAMPGRTGYLRGHPERATLFAIESFVDELARAAGLEPLAFRMAMLGSNPRLARCLQTAATLAAWDGGGRGSSMGLAAGSVYGSHIALVASASLAADQSVELHRLVACVDCGRAVNPQLIRQQVESGLIWALGLAEAPAPEWVTSVPRARTIGSVGLPRIARTPQIDVAIVPSSAAPGGVSGLAPAVLAPAVANAIYAATGKRLRSLPFDTAAA